MSTARHPFVSWFALAVWIAPIAGCAQNKTANPPLPSSLVTQAPAANAPVANGVQPELGGAPSGPAENIQAAFTSLPPVAPQSDPAATATSADVARAKGTPAELPPHWFAPVNWLRKADAAGLARKPDDYKPAPLGNQSG